jgi:hypothetical protein
MDHRLVPGVLFTNHPLRQSVPDLQHLAGALMAEFGVTGFPRQQSPSAKNNAAD